MYQRSPVSDRIIRIRKRFRETTPPITIERFDIVTDFCMEHSEMPTRKKRVQMYKRLCEKMPTPIHADELIVGQVSGKYRGSALYPELNNWMFADFRDKDPRQRELEPYDIDDEDLKSIYRAEKFWAKNNTSKKMDLLLPEDFKEILGNGMTTFGVHDLCTMPIGHYCPNFEKVINVGFAAIKKEAEEHIKEMKGKFYGTDAKRYQFYDAVINVCDDIILYTKRYAAEAARQAEQEVDPKRKTELEMMAEALDWIMENPARTFYEATQAIFLYQISQGLSEALHGASFGRMDQYLGKFYEKDLAEGRITKEYAQEIIDAFCLKVSEMNRVTPHVTSLAIGGYTSGQLITLGGVVPGAGEDATNPVTYMFLQSNDRLELHDPPLSLRIHKGTPDELWEAAIECNKRNGGVPTFENDDVIIPSLGSRMTLEDAQNYCLIGCVEPAGNGDEWPCCGGSGQESFLLISGAVNLAINNGYNPMPLDSEGTPSGQTGPPTGYLYEMETFDDVLNAVKTQMEYFIDYHVGFTNIHEYVSAEYAPLPVVSATMDGCMESGLDVTWGGAKYNSTGLAGIGLGTLVDSLAVIKYLCYDKKLISRKDFLNAVVTNWKDQEELRQRIHTIVPRYGNDDPSVDWLAKWVADVFAAKVLSCTGPRGNHFAPGLYPVAMHVLFGLLSWATPDGRKTGEPLSDGISPKQQMDKSGPLAVLKSASAIDQTPISNGTLLNMKFHPKSIEGEGMNKLKALVKTYFNLGGMELQFNIMSADTLRQAQKNPDEYKDLVVRIAGFSAYFVELYEGMQNEVISRAEMAL
jgi:formate C-acetyltransferase